MNELATVAGELRAGKKVISFTKGVSMKPLLKEGKTYVVLVPVYKELQIGDIALFQCEENTYILHRIIGSDGDNYITRGDNCITSERTPKERFLGVVSEIGRNGKAVSVSDARYKRYVKIWNAIWPFRRMCYRVRGFLFSFGRKIKRTLKG